VETVRAFAGAGLFQLIAALVMLLGSALLLLFINWRLTLIAFATVPAVFVLLAGFARRVSQPFRQVQQMLERLNGSLQEALAGAREAQAFNRAEVNRARFRERNTSHRKANVQAVGITSAFAPAIDVLSTLATAIVTGYGGYLVFQNSLTVGQLAAFLIYVQQFFRPVQLISQG
jgi:ATP-binding cassette subfamily B protein/subfamily B ATP-binding cassette protein MsbA